MDIHNLEEFDNQSRVRPELMSAIRVESDFSGAQRANDVQHFHLSYDIRTCRYRRRRTD